MEVGGRAGVGLGEGMGKGVVGAMGELVLGPWFLLDRSGDGVLDLASPGASLGAAPTSAKGSWEGGLVVSAGGIDMESDPVGKEIDQLMDPSAPGLDI